MHRSLLKHTFYVLILRIVANKGHCSMELPILLANIVNLFEKKLFSSVMISHVLKPLTLSFSSQNIFLAMPGMWILTQNIISQRKVVNHNA